MSPLRRFLPVLALLTLTFLPRNLLGQAADPPAWDATLLVGAGVLRPDRNLGYLDWKEGPEFGLGYDSGVRVFTTPAFSLGLHLRTPLRWLALRADVARTAWANLYRTDHAYSESCGQNCYAFKYSSTILPRDVSLSYASVSAEIAPFGTWPVRPYFTLGGGVNRLAFAGNDRLASVSLDTLRLDGLGDSGSGRVWRGGIGLEIPAGAAVLRLEALDHLNRWGWEPGEYRAPVSVVQQATRGDRNDFLITVGARLRPW